MVTSRPVSGDRRSSVPGSGPSPLGVRPVLARIVDDWHPDLVVHDAAELAAAPAAHARGIPHVTVGFSGALPQALVQGIVKETAEVWRAEGLDVPADAVLNDPPPPPPEDRP